MGIREQIIERWGQDGTHWSCLGQDGERKLRWLIQQAWPDRRDLDIVEIGTHQGVSTAILAEYGRVWTFDITDYPLKDEIWAHFGCAHKITPIIVADDRETTARLKDMTFDLAFVDGCHALDSVMRNFQAVRKCGHVIFHDYEPKIHGERTVKHVDNLRTGRTTKLIPFAMWEAIDFEKEPRE